MNNERRSWLDSLKEDVLRRLGNCCSRRSDLQALVDAKWGWMVASGKKEQGFTKEDALISVLELLDCNGQFFDLTHDEYADLITGA